MTTPHIYTTRPQSVDDLSDYVRQGHLIVLIETARLLDFPAVATHLVAAIAAAETDDRLTFQGNELRALRTDAEMAKQLAQAQQTWDQNRNRYCEALDDPNKVPPWGRSSVDRWAEGEGLAAIEWPS